MSTRPRDIVAERQRTARRALAAERRITGSRKKERTYALMTRPEASGVRRVLALCSAFIEGQFKDTNPAFSIEGGLWTKEELQQHIAAALKVLPENPV